MILSPVIVRAQEKFIHMSKRLVLSVVSHCLTLDLGTMAPWH